MRLVPDTFDAAWGNGLDDIDGDLLRCPAIRNRPQETLDFAERLVERTCRELGRSPCKLSEEAVTLLTSYQWGVPVELDNVIHAAVERTQDDEISGSDLRLPLI